MRNDNTRIYVVTQTVDGSPKNDKQHLVRAASQAQAIRHVVGEQFTAEVADQNALVYLVSAGKSVQDATEQAAP